MVSSTTLHPRHKPQIADMALQEYASRHAMAERPHREMMEKSRLRETFFSVRNVPPPRPDSVHTEFMETDWEEDDILSELDDGDSSPRLSLDSVSTSQRPCDAMLAPLANFTNLVSDARSQYSREADLA